MRHLPFVGTPNFRDLGGYPTEDGRRVKWGYLFRSGHLSRLNDQDLELLGSLQLDVICDFRRQDEQTRDPSRLPTAGPRWISLSISPGSNESVFAEFGRHVVDRQAMFDFMVSINRNLALRHAEAYSAMLRQLTGEQPARMLFHCAAGKDRTGFAAAIILSALGVPRAQVMEDYLLTNRYFLPSREVKRLSRKYSLEFPDEIVLPAVEVHPEYIQAAFDAIDEHYDSVPHYLEQVLGLDRSGLERLRSHYLE